MEHTNALERSGPPRWVFMAIMAVVLLVMTAWVSYLAYETGYMHGVQVATEDCSSAPDTRKERSESRLRNWGVWTPY